jgi:transcription elongation GreA/GreB family factor
MDKKAILKRIENQIAASLATLTQAALAARDAAIHTESKAEDQYDTRGLEASYLAGAQSKRVAELEELLAMYRHLDIKAFAPHAAIASTALIELDQEGISSFYLLMPKGGGLTTEWGGRGIQVITPQSPLGESLLGKKVGETVEITLQKTIRDYEIRNIW